MYLFLTDTCKGIIKSSGVREFCPNSKFPDKRMAGLTRFGCTLSIPTKRTNSTRSTKWRKNLGKQF